MSHYDEILELSLSNYGLVSFGQAIDAGISGSELNRYVATNRLEKVGHGLYRVNARLITPYDRFAQAVALVGADSRLHGTAVLALLGLAHVNPRELEVATNRRVRKALPSWIRVVKAKTPEEVVKYHGIPCQPLAQAITASKRVVMPDRLASAASRAYSQGLLTKSELKALRKELEHAEGKAN